MIYIYDILLNFNKNLIEYFEWEDNDNIKYAKKIGLFKINKKTMIDFITKEVELSQDFVKNTLKYEFDGTNNIENYCLFTDGDIVIGVIIKNRRINLLSRLIIDEEEEVINLSDKLNSINIDYKIIRNKNNDDSNLTRKEKKLKNSLLKEIEVLYKNKDKKKLEYLYYEYTGKEKDNIDYIYNFLINSLNNITDKHDSLFDILKLSNKRN